MHLSAEEITRLSAPERLAIIEQLWTSLGDEVPVTQAQKDELMRRLDSFEEDRLEGITWENLKAELARRPR